MRSILWNPLLSFLAPCDGADSCWKDQGHFFKYAQGNNAHFWNMPRTTMQHQRCHLNSSAGSILLLNQQKRADFSELCYGFPDHHWGRTLLPSHHTGSFISIPRPNSIILGVKVAFNIEYLLITENEVWLRGILNAGKKNLESLELFVNNLNRKLVFLDMLEWRHLQVLPKNSWHGSIRHFWLFCQILDGSVGVPPDSYFFGAFYQFGGSSRLERLCSGLFWISPVTS